MVNVTTVGSEIKPDSFVCPNEKPNLEDILIIGFLIVLLVIIKGFPEINDAVPPPKKYYSNDHMYMTNSYISKVMDKEKQITYHVLGWLAFIFYELLTIHFVIGVMSSATDYITHYLLSVLLFYANIYIIVYETSYTNKVVFIIGEIGFYLVINYYLSILLHKFGIHTLRTTDPISPFLMGSFWRCMYFLGLSSVYGFAVNQLKFKTRINNLVTAKLQNEKHQLSLEKDLLLTQNNHLRAQVNPHLFFNTLNFVYNSVYKVSPKAGEAIMLLSDITRYSISSVDENGLVYLKDEIENIQNLIALNQIRFNGKLNIDLDIEEECAKYKIIPLVLLTLVENVFKHGDISNENEPALIKLKIKDGYIFFYTKNKKSRQLKLVKGNSVGLANVRFRLQNTYSDGFTWSIHETDEHYIVDLVIKSDFLCAVAI